MQSKMISKRVLSLLLVLAMALALMSCATERAGNTPSLDTVLSQTAGVLLEKASEPVCGSVGGDWVALGLARWSGDVPEDWFDRYYAAVEHQVKSCEGVLDTRKYTEYSRVILALTAMGRNPADVAGYNLLQPLADYEQTIFQGVNGAAYALLALDSGDYELPRCEASKTQATREMYIQHLLSKEVPGGGWSLMGDEAEVDLTAMVLQALAKYQEQTDVAQAIDRALTFLSAQQDEDGGYTAYDVQGSESVAQVIVALTELGIPMDDPRFVKNGNSLQNRLLDFRTEDHGFCHVLGEDANLIATEQAFYALVALYRGQQNQSSLYRMAPEVNPVSENP